MQRFEVLGIVDEPGHCELCGTYCPARRVAVRLPDGDDVNYWGVVCAAEARSGRRDATIARQLRAEAEEAGAYGDDRPHAGRRSRPAPVRRQTRREAVRLAALDAAEARAVWLRTSSPVAATLAAMEADGNPWPAAEARYLAAGHSRASGHHYGHADGRRAIVNTASPADVARFERAGFTPDACGPLSAWPPLEALATA